MCRVFADIFATTLPKYTKKCHNFCQDKYYFAKIHLAAMSMSEKPIASNGKGFLVILLPLSFLIIFLVATWKIWLALIVLIIGFNLWQLYQWQQWSLKVNPIFHQLVQDTQGKITPMDLAIRGNFSGSAAKRYLDTKGQRIWR